MQNTINDYRKAHGLTYSQMALLAGLSSRSVVYLHCTKQRAISAESAMKYHYAFGIPLSELRPDLWPPDVTATPTSPPAPGSPEEVADAAACAKRRRGRPRRHPDGTPATGGGADQGTSGAPGCDAGAA